MTTATQPLIDCTPPSDLLTLDQARDYALDVLAKCDLADGKDVLHSLITRTDALEELVAAREALDRLSLYR